MKTIRKKPMKFNLIRTADFRDIVDLWVFEKITTSKAAEMLNARANEALRKLTAHDTDHDTDHD